MTQGQQTPLFSATQHKAQRSSASGTEKGQIRISNKPKGGKTQMCLCKGKIRSLLAFHGHTTLGSEPRLQPTPQLTATLDP